MVCPLADHWPYRKGWLLLLLWASLLSVGTGLSVDPRKLPGIWKLHTESLPYEQDIREKLKGLLLPEEGTS